MQVCATLHKSMQSCLKVSKVMQKCAKSLVSMRKCAEIWEGRSKLEIKLESVPKHEKMCQNMIKSFKCGKS